MRPSRKARALSSRPSTLNPRPSIFFPSSIFNPLSSILSRQRLAARGVQQPIPFVARQLQLRRLGCLPNAVGIHRADDGNDFAWVLQKPRKRNDRARRSARIGYGFKLRKKVLWPIALLRHKQPLRAVADQPRRQWTPG